MKNKKLWITPQTGSITETFKMLQLKSYILNNKEA